MGGAAALAMEQGWSAGLKLGFRPARGKTVLAHRERHGPLAVQRPFYPEGGICHVYLLHPPGGVVGGDRLQIDAGLAEGSHALVTTPGATKFYRSAGEVARQAQCLRLDDGSSLEWLPQENILFPGAQVAMQTRVDLSGDARLALWEIHCLGRPVIDEGFDQGSLDASLEVYRDGRPLLIERLRVDAGSRRRLSQLGGRAVTATAVFTHADDDCLRIARECIDALGIRIAGATRIGDLLVLRYLGDSTELARNLFTGIWRVLRERLLRRAVSTPRIWNT